MLASITPLGERGRGSTWGVTISAFVAGATTAGAVAGAAIGALGRDLFGGGGVHARLGVLAIAMLVALALDARPGGAPGPRRQVNERWLDEFRGWVYGLGFGAQLGVGVTTVVSSAATYAAMLAALLSGGALRGALVLGSFGAVRGLTPLVAAGVRRPDQLIALHARLDRLRRPAARSTAAALAAFVAVAALGALA
jgi:sulfite exporter TauE/SafE